MMLTLSKFDGDPCTVEMITLLDIRIFDWLF